MFLKICLITWNNHKIVFKKSFEILGFFQLPFSKYLFFEIHVRHYYSGCATSTHISLTDFQPKNSPWYDIFHRKRSRLTYKMDMIHLYFVTVINYETRARARPSNKCIVIKAINIDYFCMVTRGHGYCSWNSIRISSVLATKIFFSF